MQLGVITAQRLVAALGAESRMLPLEPGSELAARVLAAPNGAGEGAISLAGLRLAARLPAGVQAGEELRLTILRVGGGELLAKIVRAEAAPSATAGELAGTLALSGDGDLLRGALALAAGGPLWLPGGRAAELAVDADAGGEGGGAPSGHARAAFVLHCPRLGAIEVRLAIDGGSLRAGVVAPAGAAADAARETLPALVESLGRATARPVSAEVRARQPAETAPRPPAGRIDERA